MGTLLHLWALGLVQGNYLHLSEAHRALQSCDTWKRQEEEVCQRSICSDTGKLQAHEKAANTKQPWHSKADVNTKCCFCICRGCYRAHYRTPPCTHTQFCWPSQMEGWRNLSRDKRGRRLLQAFSFASRWAGKPGEGCHRSHQPEDAWATAIAPSTSGEPRDFKST